MTGYEDGQYPFVLYNRVVLQHKTTTKLLIFVFSFYVTDYTWNCNIFLIFHAWYQSTNISERLLCDLVRFCFATLMINMKAF